MKFTDRVWLFRLKLDSFHKPVWVVSGHDFHRPPKKSLSERFVTGRDFSRADKPFIFLPEPASAGGTRLCFDFFSSLSQSCRTAIANTGLQPLRVFSSDQL